MARQCPECLRVKRDEDFWWGAKRCRSCVAQRAGRLRTEDAQHWRDFVRRTYGLRISLSRRRFEEFSRESAHLADRLTPKKRRNVVARYLAAAGGIAFFASLGGIPLLLFEVGTPALLVSLFSVGVFLWLVSVRLDAPRDREVASLAGDILRGKLSEYETEQLEYEAFYGTQEWRRLRDMVISRDGRVCANCKRRIRDDADLTIDHIKPRSQFPELALDPDNLQVLCRGCNSSKGASC